MVLDLVEALEGVWVGGWVGVVLVILLCPFLFICIVYHGGGVWWFGVRVCVYDALFMLNL